MNILQINTSNNGGGAAIFCSRLKSFLDKNNIINWLLVKSIMISKGENTLELKRSFLQKVLNRLFHTEGFGNDTYQDIKAQPFWDKVDLIHFHNLQGGYFNISALPKLTKERKSLWTLHDPWIINNGKRLVPEYEGMNKSANPVFNIFKKRAINRSEITLVTPSSWLKDIIIQEYPLKKIEVIHNGIDTKTFNPTEKAAARKILGLPLNKNIVLFVAHGGLKNIAKGSFYFEQIKNNRPNLLFVEVGGDNYVEDEQELALYYSAADLLLNPSLADSFGLTVAESMSCGTPVVAFKTGGIPEIIDHKINGYLAQYKNIQDLDAGIDFILDNNKNNELGLAAREKVLEKFDINMMCEKYLSLYKKIIAN